MGFKTIHPFGILYPIKLGSVVNDIGGFLKCCFCKAANRYNHQSLNLGRFPINIAAAIGAKVKCKIEMTLPISLIGAFFTGSDDAFGLIAGAQIIGGSRPALTQGAMAKGDGQRLALASQFKLAAMAGRNVGGHGHSNRLRAPWQQNI